MRPHPILLGLLLVVSAESVSANVLRFSDTVRGGLAITGNTLGLSKATSENGPGMRDGIGTFIALDPESVDAIPANPSNPWPPGTTASWTSNGSSAVLDLPEGSSVLHAELIWGGSYDYPLEDVSAELGSSVTLAFESSATTSVSPSEATATTLDLQAEAGYEVRYYVRSSDVTSFVAMHGAGGYTASAIPATQGEFTNSLNAAGWTLVVAYHDADAPVSHLAIVVAGSWIEEGRAIDVVFDGFTTPSVGPVAGRVLASAIEGDASFSGDQLLFEGATESGFSALSGPNNPSGNFFASQLNDGDGELDGRGSFGSSNHVASTGTNVAGGRQGWDVTAIAISDGEGHLQTDLEQATVRASSSGDGYVLTLVALEVDEVPEVDRFVALMAALASLTGLRRVSRSARRQPPHPLLPAHPSILMSNCAP